ncbi:MAG TPA: protein kinase [Ktedonobacteraceae bacterium]|nr:protein kinase [Ktedonobacteraceae bacterium]
MGTSRGQHLIGQEIGSCILEKLLGYGGSSAVFLAQSRTPDEKVAVKVFLPRSTMDKKMQKNFYIRFLREAQAASELDHPNILPIYSYGEHHGLPYIVMPYMAGGTLAEYVSRHGPLSLSEAQYYLEQISSALDYAHEHGCVHCDVKPANILLDGTGHALLSDFGIVRLMQPEDATVQESMKSAETLMGTPDYVSPEQALGQELDGRSDVYSLGVTLFFLLIGSPPFKAENSIAMALMHVHETPPVLGMLRADTTPQIDQVIAKALAKLPNERFQTAGEFNTTFAEAVAQADRYPLPESSDKKRAGASNDGDKQAIVALKPIVHIKPVRQGAFKLRRFVLPAVVLLVIISSVITVFAVSRPTNTHGHPHATSTTTPTDYLADEQIAWPQDQQDRTFFFQNRQYHIRNPYPKDIAMAFYKDGNSTFTNFSLTVTTSEIRGAQDDGDYYGIVFRSSAGQAPYYLFEIDAGDGQFGFWRYDKQAPSETLAFGDVSDLLPNLGQHNDITAVVVGNTFKFFVNKIPLGNVVTDPKPPLRSGDIGLSVEEQNTEVAFSQLKITRLDSR